LILASGMIDEAYLRARVELRQRHRAQGSYRLRAM